MIVRRRHAEQIARLLDKIDLKHFSEYLSAKVEEDRNINEATGALNELNYYSNKSRFAEVEYVAVKIKNIIDDDEI